MSALLFYRRKIRVNTHSNSCLFVFIYAYVTIRLLNVKSAKCKSKARADQAQSFIYVKIYRSDKCDCDLVFTNVGGVLQFSAWLFCSGNLLPALGNLLLAMSNLLLSVWLYMPFFYKKKDFSNMKLACLLLVNYVNTRYHWW